MRVIEWKNLRIGEGIPKICVPIMGATKDEIVEQANKVVQEQPDLIEWRADFFEKLEDGDSVSEVCAELEKIIGTIPLIFTVRTSKEGGKYRADSVEQYQTILKNAGKNAGVDLIDVELFMEVRKMSELIKELQQNKKLVIVSNHHFHETPSVEAMDDIFQIMEESGADIRKLAVMPNCEEDVLALLQATVHANQNGQNPVISMSMGAKGAVSRVSGQVFGSCVTFAAVGEASAPGQIPIRELKQILKNLQL